MKLILIVLVTSVILSAQAQEEPCAELTPRVFPQEVLDAVAGARVDNIDQMLGLTDILNNVDLNYGLVRGPSSCFPTIRWQIHRGAYMNTHRNVLETPASYQLFSSGNDRPIFSTHTRELERNNLERQRQIATLTRSSHNVRRVYGTYPTRENLESRGDRLEYSVTNQRLMRSSFFQSIYEDSSRMSLDFRKLDERTLRMTYRFRNMDGQNVEMRNCVYSRVD